MQQYLWQVLVFLIVFNNKENYRITGSTFYENLGKIGSNTLY